jgi:hypothetical protein
MKPSTRGRRYFGEQLGTVAWPRSAHGPQHRNSWLSKRAGSPVLSASPSQLSLRGHTVDRMAKERLFEGGPRSDRSPGRGTEKSFHFLDRRAGAFWDRVRSHVESCYAAFPDDTGDLIGRLRDDNEEQHLGAWWELYTFTLFHRLGYTIEVHPKLPGRERDGGANSPDFLVTTDRPACMWRPRWSSKTTMVPTRTP